MGAIDCTMSDPHSPLFNDGAPGEAGLPGGGDEPPFKKPRTEHEGPDANDPGYTTDELIALNNEDSEPDKSEPEIDMSRGVNMQEVDPDDPDGLVDPLDNPFYDSRQETGGGADAAAAVLCSLGQGEPVGDDGTPTLPTCKLLEYVHILEFMGLTTAGAGKPASKRYLENLKEYNAKAAGGNTAIAAVHKFIDDMGGVVQDGDKQTTRLAALCNDAWEKLSTEQVFYSICCWAGVVLNNHMSHGGKVTYHSDPNRMAFHECLSQLLEGVGTLPEGDYNQTDSCENFFISLPSHCHEAKDMTGSIVLDEGENKVHYVAVENFFNATEVLALRGLREFMSTSSDKDTFQNSPQYRILITKMREKEFNLETLLAEEAISEQQFNYLSPLLRDWNCKAQEKSAISLICNVLRIATPMGDLAFQTMVKADDKFTYAPKEAASLLSSSLGKVVHAFLIKVFMLDMCMKQENITMDTPLLGPLICMLQSVLHRHDIWKDIHTHASDRISEGMRTKDIHEQWKKSTKQLADDQYKAGFPALHVMLKCRGKKELPAADEQAAGAEE